MDLLLLAAGLGSRLGERTKDLPKALIEVHGKTLLDYVLDHAAALEWIDRVIVVTGFEREKMLRHLETRAQKKPLIEAHNGEYRKGNFYSLYKGLSHVGTSWVTMNVDHIYPSRLLRHCWKQHGYVSAICDHDRPLMFDCMKVKLDATSRIQNIHKKLTDYDRGYIGMTFVAEDGKAHYMQAVETVRAKNDDSAWAEMVLQTMADEGHSPNIVDASGFGWLEVDDETDLARAEQTLQNNPHFLGE